MAALDLDREPQIHVGKAHHIRHPNRTIYAARSDHNRAILTRNKNKAAARHDRMSHFIAKTDTAAYLEARQNATIHDLLHDDVPVLDDLQRAYGRPPPATSPSHAASDVWQMTFRRTESSPGTVAVEQTVNGPAARAA